MSLTPVLLDVPKGKADADCTYYLATPAYAYTYLDTRASGLVVSSDVGCEKCRVSRRMKVDRVRVAIESWNGAHIFYPTWLYGVLLVTEEVKQFVESGEFSNFSFCHQDDYSEKNEHSAE
ncbi:MAG: hypothetical protein ACI92S_004627 [Planctomycetaceae bacterium]|jgi:hypothetical protein